ncbi:TIGR04219 family outer membrane beta-barrel protein [Thalassotalea profundi]|uniref:Outer membrane protein n=1 Tax=Thalassotalea profundi TaxID=2036687 RepID=A0ABQ3J346_9GAMM|nr:TIGR04219 family outer membrane beta-barrel protein [Thalassotalea profundi]GHE99777.1 outer membrane protein [Thalassotalea profundi]
MKKTILVTCLLLGCSTNVTADVIGVYLGASVWDQQAKGNLGSSSEQLDFNLADQQQMSYSLAVEHPLPFIPNAKIATSSLETDGAITLNAPFEFKDQTFDASSQASANFDVTFVDYTLYYELFDNDLISFDFGFTARDFDGSVTVEGQINGNAGSGVISTSEIVPMLYARTNVGLPFTGFNFFAEGNFLSVTDHTLYDYQAGISYELVDNLAIDINLTLGYRSLKLELDDLNDLYTDIEFSGYFAGVVVHF